MSKKSNRRSVRDRRNEANRNSRIVTLEEGMRSTFTSRRDPGSLTAAIVTNPSNATDLVLSRNGATFQFSGNESRTIFALLSKHYGYGSY